MPRYFVDVSAGPSLVRDNLGVELSSLKAACCAAVDAMPEFSECSDAISAARMVLVVVRDEDGRAVRATSMSLMPASSAKPAAREQGRAPAPARAQALACPVLADSEVG